MKIIAGIIIGFILTACGGQENKNKYIDYTWYDGIESGISWPKDQLLPIFAYPENSLDGIIYANFRRQAVGYDDSQYANLFASLQGIVNSEKPRLLLVHHRHWIHRLGMQVNYYMWEERFDLIKKYQNYIKGIVLYDTALSPHYANLASTIANINKGFVPVTPHIKTQLEENGIIFNNKNIIDITGLSYRTDHGIYNYLYDNYWKKCSKRLLISIPPDNYFPVRDIAAATGAAVIYCDVRTPEGRMIYEKFLKDMADNKSSSVVLGWYTDERWGVTSATKFGIPTLPADFYRSGSVFSGMSNLIKPPQVPKRDNLENKAYIALYMSDGDNIQYMQNGMINYWNNARNDRGKIAVNWTVSPAMADIGPGILNYFYSNSTEKECFVTGPSGVGYIMPFNSALHSGNFLENEKYAADYARMTEIYLQKTGIRVITIWDGANEMVRNAYEKYCRNLYGLTVQDWYRRKYPEVTASNVNGRLRFDLLKQQYQSIYNVLLNGTVDEHGHMPGIADELQNWDEKSPLFLSYQLQVWASQVNTGQLVRMEAELRERFPDKKFEFVRADHYFSYYNENDGLPFNLCMLSSTKVTASGAGQTEYLTDGTTATLWEMEKNGSEIFLQFDFGQEYNVNRYVIRHAGSSGMDNSLNTKAWKVDVSADGANWTTVDRQRGNKSAVTDIDINAVAARFVKITIQDTGAKDSAGIHAARIAEVEIYGSRL